MNSLYTILLLLLICFNNSLNCIKLSFYTFTDTNEYTSKLKDVTRTFSFSDFMIQENNIACKQKIFYTNTYTFFNYFCLCKNKKDISPCSSFVILNLKNENIETYKTKQKYDKTYNSKTFESIETPLPTIYDCIGKPLEESIFIEKRKDDMPTENSCKVYARNKQNTLLIGSASTSGDFYKTKTKFYLWKNDVYEDNQKLTHIEELPILDKKAHLIVKIFFITDNTALIFFSDGHVVKLDVTLKK